MPWLQNEEGTKKVMQIPQLKRLMSYCDCVCVTDKDAEHLLSEMDTSGDGVVDLEEFKHVSNKYLSCLRKTEMKSYLFKLRRRY